jgi:hypothetical protein
LIRKLAGGGWTVKGVVDTEGVVRIRHGWVPGCRPDRRDLFKPN